MLSSAQLATALAAAVIAWGTPPPDPSGPVHIQTIFEPDPATSLNPEGHGDANKGQIRAIIRRHINEVKGCYQDALELQPNLSGRIMVQFTVAASGKVIASVLQNSTMGHPGVERCAVEAVRRWQFPKPIGGGIVIISYPFMFTPGVPPTKLVAGTNGAGLVEIERLEPTLFVHRSTDARAVPSNGLVAVTVGGLLLVDTSWTDAQTEAVLAWGDRELRRPWIGAVITHDHVDRDGGLAALQRRKIPVSALDLTVARLGGRGVRGVATLFRARDGAFNDPRGFEAYYPGPGHAPDNIVLHFPELLYAGCLVKSMRATDLGFTNDADLAAWPAALRNMRARYHDDMIVPGHGPVDMSGEAYQHTLDLLAAAKHP